MDLDRLLERARRLEERAAALYRSWATAARQNPDACALWTALAREEEDHARSLRRAAEHLRTRTGWRTRVDGWAEALAEVEARLDEAERLGPLARTERQLAAALALEDTEIDPLRHLLLELSDGAEPQPDGGAHARRLADAAERLCDDPDVHLQAALVRTRARLGTAH